MPGYFRNFIREHSMKEHRGSRRMRAMSITNDADAIDMWDGRKSEDGNGHLIEGLSNMLEKLHTLDGVRERALSIQMSLDENSKKRHSSDFTIKQDEGSMADINSGGSGYESQSNYYDDSLCSDEIIPKLRSKLLAHEKMKSEDKDTFLKFFEKYESLQAEKTPVTGTREKRMKDLHDNFLDIKNKGLQGINQKVLARECEFGETEICDIVNTNSQRLNGLVKVQTEVGQIDESIKSIRKSLTERNDELDADLERINNEYDQYKKQDLPSKMKNTIAKLTRNNTGLSEGSFQLLMGKAISLVDKGKRYMDLKQKKILAKRRMKSDKQNVVNELNKELQNIQRKKMNEVKALEESKTRLKQEVADFCLFSTYFLKEIDQNSVAYNDFGKEESKYLQTAAMDLEVSSLCEHTKRVNDRYETETFGPLAKKEFFKLTKAEPQLQDVVLTFLRNFSETNSLMMSEIMKAQGINTMRPTLVTKKDALYESQTKHPKHDKDYASHIAVSVKAIVTASEEVGKAMEYKLAVQEGRNAIERAQIALRSQVREALFDLLHPVDSRSLKDHIRNELGKMKAGKK